MDLVINGVNIAGTELAAITERIQGRLSTIKENFYGMAVDLLELKEEFGQLPAPERKALGNLDGWCRKHFGFGDSFARRLVLAKTAQDNLRKNVTTVTDFPATEGAIRPLTKFNSDPKKQAEIYLLAYEKAGGCVPAEDNIKAAIEQVEREFRDIKWKDKPATPEKPESHEETIEELEARLEAERLAEKEKRRAEREQEDRQADENNRRFSEALHDLLDGLGIGLGEREAQLAKAIIEAGYRAVSKKIHPDVGGSHEDMVALNNAKEKLLNAIR